MAESFKPTPSLRSEKVEKITRDVLYWRRMKVFENFRKKKLRGQCRGGICSEILMAKMILLDRLIHESGAFLN